MIKSGSRDALERTIGLVLVAGLVVLAAVALLARSAFVELRRSEAESDRTRAAIQAVEGAVRGLLDADAGHSGHLLTSHPADLALFGSGAAAALRHLGAAVERVAPVAGQQQRVQRLQQLAAAQLAAMEQALALQRQQQPAAALAAARADAAARRMDEVRAVSQALIADEQARLATRTAAARAAQASEERFFAAFGAGLVAVFGAGFLLVRRQLRRRLAASDALRDSERRLQANERRTKGMADTLPALIAYVDASQTYRFTNAQYDTFFGAAADAYVGKTMLDLLGPASYAVVAPHVNAVLAGERQTFERMTRGGGRDVHVIVNYVPDIDVDGKVAGFYVMVMDITERKNAELAQRLSERRMKAVTDNVPAVIAHLDRDHRYLLANEQFRRLYGIDPATLLGQTLRETSTAPGAEQIAGHLSAVLRGETRRFEMREVVNGLEHHLQHSLVPDVGADGSVQGYYQVSFDITDLRRNEQLLVESGARHRAIVEEQSELVSLAARDGQLLYVNPAYARHFGLRPEQLFGRNLLDFVDPADRDTVAAALDDVWQRGLAGAGENRMLTPDGDERWVAWTNKLQRDGHGRTALRSVGRDVTEQRRAERALQASQAFLTRTGRLAGVGGWQLDLTNNVLTWADETRRIHEVAAGYVPTLETAIQFYAPEAQAVIAEAVRQAMETGASWDLELPLVTATGRRIWARAVGDAEFDAGAPVRLIGAFQDITARKTADAMLMRSERRLRAVTDNVPALISQFDTEHRFVFANARLLQLHKRSAAAVLGSTQSALHGDAAFAEHRAEFEAALRGEMRSFEVRTVVDGSEHHLQQSLVPDVDEAGTVQGYFSLAVDTTELRRNQQLLQASERRLQLVTDNLPALVGHVDREQRYTFVNEHFRRLLGIEPEAMLGRTMRELRGDAVYADLQPRIERALAGESVVFETAGRGPGGDLHLRSEYVPDIDANGVVNGIYAMTFDITQNKLAELALEQKERMLRTITDNLPVFIGYVDRGATVRFVNATGLAWLGLQHGQAHGRPLREVIGETRWQRRREQVQRVLAGERLEFDDEAAAGSRSQTTHQIFIPDLQPDGSVAGFFNLVTDITALKQTQRQLEELARVDALTGLPNRRHFDEKLREAMLRRARDAQPAAVMFLDVDHFKRINDTLGHAAGDTVLREFGARLQACVRATDVAARLAGDEFVVLLEGVGSAHEAGRLAGKIVEAMRADFTIAGQPRRVTTSLGVAFVGNGAASAEALLQSADEALYAAKMAGRDGFQLFVCQPAAAQQPAPAGQQAERIG